MDGIDRYFNPNTLDGLSIYTVDEALLVDGSNAMQADADMGGYHVKNVADATAPDEAVNFGQFTTALAGKADDATVVHLAGNETITGIKNFTALPTTSLLATTSTQFVPFGQMNTALALKADITYVNSQDALKADITYVNSQDALKLNLTGGTMTGSISMSTTNKITQLADPTANRDAAHKKYVDDADALRVLKAGDTMTGALTLPGDPTLALQATPKQYCDLKATITYVNTQDNLRVLKSGDTMTGALSMSNTNINNVATATLSHQAVNLAQMQAADSAFVTLNTAQTITAKKTFTVLPESSVTATTANQLVNRVTALSYISYDNFGLVHFTTGRNTPLTYATLYACNVDTFNSALTSRTYTRSRIHGTTVTLTPRVTYYGCIIRTMQNFTFPPATYSGATVQIGLYTVNNVLVAVSNNFECVDTTVAINGDYRNHYVAFQNGYTPSDTDTFILAILIVNAPSQDWGFLGAQVNNGDLFQNQLNTVAGLPLQAHQKGWISTGTYTTLPATLPTTVTTAIPIWVGLTGLPNNQL